MAWFSNQWNKLQTAVNETFPGQPVEGGPAGYKRARGGASGGAEGPIRCVIVVFGRQRLEVRLPPSPTPTLGTLKAHLVTQTDVPYEQLKLISNGFILRDDRAPLASFGLRDGARLTLVGTAGGAAPSGDRPGAQAPQLPPKARDEPEEDSEVAVQKRIAAVLARLNEHLLPDVDAFTARLPPPSLPAELPDKTQKRLSEMLLRVLLELDGITVPDDETRKSRKEAVRKVQTALDRVDKAWEEIKTGKPSSEAASTAAPVVAATQTSTASAPAPASGSTAPAAPKK